MGTSTGPRLPRRSVLAALGALPWAGGCADRSWTSFPPTSLVIATGNPGGVFSRYGDALAAVLAERLDGVTASTRATDASVENLHLVARGDCDLGLSLADTAADAVRGTGSFAEPLAITALARGYDSFVHLVVRADSEIVELADLRGGRVGLGAPGSGTRVVADRILRRAGLGPADLTVATDSLEPAAAALARGEIDAFFFVSGIPNQTVLDLSRRIGIRLLPLESVVSGLAGRYGPEYVAAPIPASTYGLSDGVDTVSVRNHILADPRMREDLAYAVTRVIFEEQGRIDRRAPGVRQPTAGAAIFTSPLELHPGAVRYYRERRR